MKKLKVSEIMLVQNYYQKNNANIHRSVHELASRATIQYEHARSIVAQFINAQTQEIIFTGGTTDSMNKLAFSLKAKINAGDEIVLTEMEHHSNLVPWQQLAKEQKATLRWLAVNKEDDFRLDLSHLETIITKKTKILAITHVSNVLGTINPLKEIIQRVRTINPECIVIVDAAQSIPHLKVDVKDLGCDFLAFSGHKAIGPTGIGVLFGKSQLLKTIEPVHTGGGMIAEVTKEQTSFTEIPYKFEAGTPNIAGAVGLATALQYLRGIGMENIEKQMHQLCDYGLKALSQLPGVAVLGPQVAEMRAPIFSFVINGIHPHDVGEILNREGIAIRGGNHCAMPLFNKIGFTGASRASLYIYNSTEEIDRLVAGIKTAQKIFKITAFWFSIYYR